MLDNNLLSSPKCVEFLEQMIDRKYAVNFSQTLDINYLNEGTFELLNKVNSMNSRFTRPMHYFSCNNLNQIKQFIAKEKWIKGFGPGRVTVLTMFGFNTKLSED